VNHVAQCAALRRVNLVQGTKVMTPWTSKNNNQNDEEMPQPLDVGEEKSQFSARGRIQTFNTH
jgi:hypothetical protein